MSMWRGLAVAALLVGGCGDSEATVQCGVLLLNVSVSAVDATTSLPLPITVTVDGATPDDYGCISDSPAPAPPCAGIVRFRMFDSHVVRVSADGYQPQSLTLDGGKRAGSCPQPSNEFDEQLSLSKL